MFITECQQHGTNSRNWYMHVWSCLTILFEIPVYPCKSKPLRWVLCYFPGFTSCASVQLIFFINSSASLSSKPLRISYSLRAAFLSPMQEPGRKKEYSQEKWKIFQTSSFHLGQRIVVSAYELTFWDEWAAYSIEGFLVHSGTTIYGNCFNHYILLWTWALILSYYQI